MSISETNPPAPTPEVVAAPTVLAYDGGTNDGPAVVLGYVVLKSLGLWLATGLLQIVSYYANLVLGGGIGPTSGWADALLRMIPFSSVGLVGVALMIYALPLSRRYFSMPGPILPRPEADTLVALITVCIGIFMMATSAINVVRGAFEFFYRIRGSGGGFSIDFASAQWITAMANFGIGAVLFLRPAWITGYWRRHVRMP